VQGGEGIVPQAAPIAGPVALPLAGERPSRYVASNGDQRPALRRVAILTLGCKLNQADSESIARAFAARGIEVIDRPVAADAYVINSCSVTHVADRKARHLVRMARRLAPGAPVVLTGCYVETAPAEITAQLGVDAAISNRDKGTIVERLAGMAAADGGAGGAMPSLRTRAFVKVQSGCNDVCAFCIVPKTRGRERSEPIADVVREVQALEAEGAREVVLTGTQLGAYGRDGSGLEPADVIAAVLAETSVPRIRFSSLQPQDITPRLLALWDDPRLCRHFHLALQSGSDSTLRRMRRRYDTVAYADAAARLRAQIGGDLAITTDVIVGFPGETEQEFDASVAFCRAMEFAQMHVFPHSKRAGTVAALMEGQVAPEAKHERMRRMLGVAAASRLAFMRRFEGRVMPVLWERDRYDGGGRTWDGLTDNYMRVQARSERALRNEIAPAKLVRAGGDAFEGEAL